MQSRHVSYAICVLLATSLSFGVNAHGDDWPQFLGPYRNGQSAETGLLSEWPADGPKVVWRQPLGVGMAGISISDGLAVSAFQDEADQFVVAFDALTGERAWSSRISPLYENAMGNGPRATPTIADGMVYVFSGEGILAAFDVEGGERKWTVDAVKAAGAKPSEYGMASSPLIVGDVVVVQTGGPGAAVAAFDRNSGDLAWKAGRGAAGYSSPILATLGGAEQVVAFTGSGVQGVGPGDGRLLWHFPFKTDYDCNTASPVLLGGNRVLISSGEKHGTVVLECDKASAKEKWSSLGGRSVLRAEWQTPVLIEGAIYGLDNIGSAGPITNLVCIDAKSGEQIWAESRFGKSNLIAADGKLFLTNMDGELIVVAASADGYREIGRARLLGATRQAPSLANGRLYLRDDAEIVCVDVRK